MSKSEYINYCSVKHDLEKCNGCINCMKRCPTEAIRIKNGKASIMYSRCVGCGECIRICPTRAKIPVYDALSTIDGYKYKIAIPSPTIYSQFNNLTDVNYVIEGLLNLGFDEVFEGAIGYEIAAEATRKLLRDKNVPKPIISSSCPAVTKLLMVRYPDLLPKLSPVLEPEKISAILARKKAEESAGLEPKDIGVFVISPCVANVFSFKAKDGEMVSEKEAQGLISGVLSFKDIYPRLLGEMKNIKFPRALSRMGRLGLACAVSGEEARSTGTEKYLAADGIENIINCLDELDRDKLNDLDFIELSACVSGCVGGILNIENPFLAEARTRSLRNYVSITLDSGMDTQEFLRSDNLEGYNVFKLADNRTDAMSRLIKIKGILKTLPGLDCGACGAPSCQAFAEDIVKGEKLVCKYRKGDSYDG